MTKTENIFLEKEIKSLKILSYGRIVMLILMSFSSIAVTTITLEKQLVLGMAFIGTILNLFNIFSLNRKKHISFTGYIGIVMDSLMLTILPFIWYSSAGGDNVPPSYFLKTSLTVVSLLIITINGLALRPIYPLIISI